MTIHCYSTSSKHHLHICIHIHTWSISSISLFVKFCFHSDKNEKNLKKINHLNWHTIYNHLHALLSLLHWLFFFWPFTFKVLILWFCSPSLSMLFSFSPLFFWLQFLLLLSGWILKLVSSGHLLYLSDLKASLSSFSALSFPDFPVPFIKTLSLFPQESLPVLFLPVTVTKLVRLSHPKSMILSKLHNYCPNWSQWPAYLCNI